MRNSTTYFTALTLFDTGAYTSFVNREIAKWLELEQHGATVAGAHLARSSRHDVPTSEVGLAGMHKGSPQLQTKLKALVLEFIDVFATKVHREPAAVEPMKIVIDEDKW